MPSVLSVLGVEDDFEWVNEGVVKLLKRYCLKGDMKANGLLVSCCKSTIIDLTTSEVRNMMENGVPEKTFPYLFSHVSTLPPERWGQML